MAIEFSDYSVQVKDMMEKTVIGCLHEAAGEIEAQAKKNAEVKTGQTKGSYGYKVIPEQLEAKIGSPLENAIWEEFGTGEYALEGKGRSGGWWIKVGMGRDEIAPDVAASYKWEKVRKDKDGNLTFVFTRGKKPRRILQRAFDAKKNIVKQIFERGMKEGMDSDN